MIVEITMEACEPGALMEVSEWPISLWIRPVPSKGGHCGEVSIQGLPEEIVTFLGDQWGLDESEAWNAILSQQPPTCVHCGLEIHGGLVQNADGDPYHELCKRKEEEERTVKRLAAGVDMPPAPPPETPRPPADLYGGTPPPTYSGRFIVPNDETIRPGDMGKDGRVQVLVGHRRNWLLRRRPVYRTVFVGYLEQAQFESNGRSSVVVRDIWNVLNYQTFYPKESA